MQSMTISFSTIEEALAAPKSRFFGVTYRDGKYAAHDSKSFFGKRIPDPELTFDVTNNKVLANLDLDGTIKFLTVYRGNYYSDNIPGVWVCKEYARTGPFAFGLTLNGHDVSLTGEEHPFTTTLLANFLPMTSIDLEQVEATLLTFAPLSSSGDVRLRGMVYALHLKNKSKDSVEGSILLPAIDRTPDQQFSGAEVCVHWVGDRQGLVTHQGAARVEREKVGFVLAPGESVWAPIFICPLGDESLQEMQGHGVLFWLNETLAYYRGITGNLEMPGDPYTAEFFVRALMQCYGSIGMSANGETVGSNWGSYPTTDFIWMKDMYYSFLPFMQLEPELFRKGMLWFLANGVRPPGNRYDGGVIHSLSNSLSSVAMAGLYYRNTGDKSFFLENPQIDAKIGDLLEETLSLRDPNAPWLFPSIWLSDAYSLGDYHTGSNIVAWTAFSAYGRVVGEVYGDIERSTRYLEIAQNIRNAIEDLCVVNGPLGHQYLEGISTSGDDKSKLDAGRYDGEYNNLGMQFIERLIENGQINLMHHDGEESDTTLIPVYGYALYDHPTYSNYMRFSLSPANPVYNPVSRGIQWGDHSACTFPGYMSGMGMITSAESLSGEAGYLTEVRHLTDVDGSLWWWPYGNDAGYGEVMRHNTCGKCGWASGVFASIFTSEILGLSADAPSNTLQFRPFSPSSDFCWRNARIGSFLVTASLDRSEAETTASLTNHASGEIRVSIELPFEKNAVATSVAIDGKNGAQTIHPGRWNRRETRSVEVTLPGNSTVTMSIAH